MGFVQQGLLITWAKGAMMIDYTLDKEKSVLHVRPTGLLRKEDFDDSAQEGIQRLVMHSGSSPE